MSEFLYVNRYQSKRGPVTQVLGHQDCMVELGFDVDEMESHKPDRWNVRMPGPEADVRFPDLDERVAEIVAAKMKQAKQIHMRDFVDQEDALLFYTAVANSKPGAKITYAVPGIYALSVRWPDLKGMMMREGWVEIGTMRLTEFGLEEARECRQFMTYQIKAKSELTDEFD